MKVLDFPDRETPWGLASERTAGEYVSFSAISTPWRELEFRQLQLVWAGSSREAELVERFNELADTWERETRAESFAHRRSMHPSYQQIIGLGEPAIGPILQRMRAKRGGHWFWALHALTGQDAAVGLTKPSEARNAWLRWGVDHGYLTPLDS